MTQGAPGRAKTALLALGAVLAVHLGLFAYFAPPRVIFSKNPIVVADYSLHVYQVDRALGAFRSAGQLWGWDPLQLAGHPVNALEDLTSKGTELFVIGLRALGVHPATGFNLLIALVMLLMPLAGYAAARLFDLERLDAVIATGLWLLLWYFDTFLHWTWWVGMISWAFACWASVLLLALFHRALESGNRRWFAAIVPLAALLAIMHPFSAMTLLVPGAALYLRARRSLGALGHALVWMAALGAGLTVLVWVGPALRFKHYVDTADTFFNATLDYAWYDFVDLLRSAENTGAPVKTPFRVLVLVAGAVALVRWRRAGDRRALALGSLVVWGVALAYLGGHLGVVRQTQPYRQIGPAMLAAAIPAAPLLRDLLAPASLRELAPRAKLLLAIAALLVAPRLVRSVFYFMPGVLPDAEGMPFAALEPKPFPARLAPAEDDGLAVRAWLEAHHGGRGRVVVHPWVLGEYLAASTKLPILGGIEQRNIQQADAHLFRRSRGGDLPGQELERYFSDYAVGFVVLVGRDIPLDYRMDVLELAKVVEQYRIYRVRAEPSYLMHGRGRIAEQGLNRVSVEDAQGPEVVLRFHWLETLRCRPSCAVERFPIPGDRAGFIRVPSPPPSFEIYNAY